MIDIHSHIIPGIDDGSKNIEMTLEMLRNAAKDGTKEIVATPHYLLEYGETKIQEVKLLVEELNSIINKENIDMKIYSGQEVYFTENILSDYLEGNIGTINDSRYMLIEFPMRRFEENIFDLLYELQVRDIIPIIAHPERYRPIIEKPSYINKFINEGYLFQLNAGSITGRFGADVKKTAQVLLDNGIYNFIGSDGHNLTNRPTGICEAISLANNKKDGMEDIFKESSRKMLNNDKVDFLGERIKDKKSLFSFFRK